MRVSRVAVLSTILVVLATGIVVRYAPEALQSYRGNAMMSRMGISSALRRAAVEHYGQTGKWPASTTEMKDAPSLKSVDLQGAKYDFQERKGGSAVYRFTFQGKSREVRIGEKSARQDKIPGIAGLSAAGG